MAGFNRFGGGVAVAGAARVSYPRARMHTVAPITDDWDDWEAAGDGGYETADAVVGAGSITITTQAPNTMAGVFRELSPAASISGRDLRLLVKCDAWHAVTHCTVLLGADGFTMEHTLTLDLRARLINPPSGEWIEVAVPASYLEQFGTPNLAALNIALIRVRDDGSRRVQLAVNAVDAFVRVSRPMVSITIDDGLASAVVAKPMMEAQGWRGTLFISPAEIDTPGFLTQADLDQFAAAAWDIGGHEMLNLAPLPPGEVATRLSRVASYLASHRYRGAHLFAYPNGAAGGVVTREVMRRFAAGFNIDGWSQPPAHVVEQRINRHSMDRWTTVQMVQGWVDQAKANGEWLILNFHTFVETVVEDQDVLVSDFAAILDYLAAEGMEVLPVSEALERL